MRTMKEEQGPPIYGVGKTRPLFQVVGSSRVPLAVAIPKTMKITSGKWLILVGADA